MTIILLQGLFLHVLVRLCVRADRRFRRAKYMTDSMMRQSLRRLQLVKKIVSARESGFLGARTSGPHVPGQSSFEIKWSGRLLSDLGLVLVLLSGAEWPP